MEVIRKLFYCFILLFILSCSAGTEEQKYLKLRNRVLEHYKNDANPLKEKAALFLLDNLKNRYAIVGERIQVYSDTIEKYHQNGDILHKKLLPLWSRPYRQDTIRDVNVLTSKYLIDQIDRSFAVLEKAAWKDQISFNDFCEYILPYRLGNEPIENWKKDIVNDSIFKVTGDSIYHIKDLRTAATKFIKKLHRIKAPGFKAKWGEDNANLPDFPYSVFKLLTTGDCFTISKISVINCRAAGFPITNDFTPTWCEHPGGHDWPAIITGLRPIPFNFPIRDTLGVYKRKDMEPTKVYRNTFSENPKSHVRLRGYCNYLPMFFNNPRLIDVTDAYIPTFDIQIPLLFKQNNGRFAYLASANRQNWQLVGWGETENGIAKFTKIGMNTVYLPAFVSEKKGGPFNYPFIVTRNGGIRYLKPNHEKLQTVKLLRKCRLTVNNKLNIEMMVDSKFQGSDNEDFKNAVTLYTIKEYPDVYYNDVKINSPKKYRYVRYLGRDIWRAQIAEIEFYSKGDRVPLKGRCIGTKGLQPFENAFDGNVLTYFEATSEKSRWVGLDLGKPMEISKIRYVSRNDKNHIVEGNQYEFFYWENGWKSLGKKTATGRVLVYDKVPTDCLFLLRNYTEGKDERIFTYEDGKQVFW